jgi:hypothetical protein
MAVCVHCERRKAGEGGLCRACSRVEGIRVLYTRRRGWTPEWELHLRRLTARACARLPLFDRNDDRNGRASNAIGANVG